MDKEKSIRKKTQSARVAATSDPSDPPSAPDPSDPPAPPDPCRALLQWHATHGRHELPWRVSHDPYAVLVSEFMLQQTTVATVTPRFEAWMTLFPGLPDLARASEEAVLAAWQGLGYYSRARRLHAASRAIMELHGGIIPPSRAALLALPGIGDYTASAILAFAFDQLTVVLDTNIARVLARWSNLGIPIDTAAGTSALRETAGSFFHSSASRHSGASPASAVGKGSRAIASALMDLGATLCTARTPRCGDCPLNASCRATSPTGLPRKSPRAVTTKRTEHRAWIVEEGRLCLQLSEGPLWHGLWILPELTTLPSGRCMARITYPITRYRVTMKLYPARSSPALTLRGFDPRELEQIAIPSPHRRAIAAAGISGHTPKRCQP